MASKATRITPEYALHPYQRQVLSDLLTTLAPPRPTPAGPKVVAHMPTGAGKTRVACAAASYLLNRPQSEGKVVMWDLFHLLGCGRIRFIG